MKKNNSAYIFILRSGVIIVLLLILLLCNSAAWLLKTFGPISFSTVLYQLNSPLQGTGHDILWDFFLNCVVKSLLEIFIFIIVWYILTILHKKLIFKIMVNVFDKKINLFFDKRRWNLARLFTWSGVVVICVASLYHYICLVGIPQYLKTIRTASNLYEEEYVSPDSVEIVFPEKKKNLIFIYLESMETTYASVDVGGGKPDNYILNLTQLAESNLSFSDTEKFGGGLVSYDGSGWTMAALMASTAGVPYNLPIQGNSAGEYGQILPGAVTLGEILQDAGYHNYFMCGSDAEFAGRKLYFEEHGDYEIFDYYTAIEDNLIPEDYYVFWGFEDKRLFQYAKEKLSDIANGGSPFNFTMLTADTHHVEGYFCELCEAQYAEQYANVIACSDRQIVNFIEWIQKQSWYENTVVVLVGDHISMNGVFWDDIPADYSRRTYNCFINTGIEKDNIRWQNRKVYSMDLFPTTLGALGAQIEGERLGLGTNLFSNRETLSEERDDFEQESMRYSNYYYQYLIKS